MVLLFSPLSINNCTCINCIKSIVLGKLIQNCVAALQVHWDLKILQAREITNLGNEIIAVEYHSIMINSPIFGSMNKEVSL